MSGYAVSAGGGRACNCMGKQPGMPACPCMMGNFIARDGRWIRREEDHGPVIPTWTPSAKLICPKCKIDFTGAVGYVCGNSDCPVQPKVTA